MVKIKILFLDDMLIRHKTFQKKFIDCDITFVETAQECIDILKKDLQWDLISLDHDLGHRIFIDSEDENSGYQVAKFLSNSNYKGKIIIHSMNPIGAKKMRDILPLAEYHPFSLLSIVI